MPTRSLTLAATTLFTLAGSVRGQDVVYYDSRGFESPEYLVGRLAGETYWSGQHNWVGITNSLQEPFLPNYDSLTVQTQHVRSGAAAAKFNAAGHPNGPSVRIELHRSTSYTSVRRYMVIDADLYWQSSTTLSQSWVLTCQQGPLFSLTSLVLFPDGHMTGDDWLNNTVVPLAGSFPRDAWNAVRLIIDYQTERVRFELNGAAIGEVGYINIGQFALLGFFLNGRGNDALYIDNLRVVNTNNPSAACYANCDQSTAAPVLNVQDFTCFLQRYAAGESYANCDNSTAAPTLNVQDFTCFLQRYAAGCE
jgi:hypothetical protein